MCLSFSEAFMRLRLTSGFAVLLAALFLLNASGLCAAPEQASRSHPCCPSHNPVPRCCVTSSVPVAAPLTGGQGVELWIPFLIPNAARPLPPAEDVVASPLPSASTHLYLHFHQLLV